MSGMGETFEAGWGGRCCYLMEDVRRYLEDWKEVVADFGLMAGGAGSRGSWIGDQHGILFEQREGLVGGLWKMSFSKEILMNTWGDEPSASSTRQRLMHWGFVELERTIVPELWCL